MRKFLVKACKVPSVQLWYRLRQAAKWSCFDNGDQGSKNTWKTQNVQDFSSRSITAHPVFPSVQYLLGWDRTQELLISAFFVILLLPAKTARLGSWWLVKPQISQAGRSGQISLQKCTVWRYPRETRLSFITPFIWKEWRALCITMMQGERDGGELHFWPKLRATPGLQITRVHGFIEQLELGLVLRIKGFRFWRWLYWEQQGNNILS